MERMIMNLKAANEGEKENMMGQVVARVNRIATSRVDSRI